MERGSRGSQARKIIFCSGPSGKPYRVYKKCPKLLRRLWKLMQVIWSKGTIPISWRRADSDRMHNLSHLVHHGNEPDHICSEYKTAAGCQQPAIRAFMDDLTVITPTHVQARWVLAELDRMATWAKIVLKPKKSRSPVIQKGKTTGRFKLLVQGEVIPNIQGNPIRCLEKWYDDSLSDRNSISSTGKQV